MRVENTQPSDVGGVVRPRPDNSNGISDIPVHETTSEQEPPAKRIRVEDGTGSVGGDRTIQPQTANIPTSKTSQFSQAHPGPATNGIGQSSVVTHSPVVSNASGSSSEESLHPPGAVKESVVPPPAPVPPAPSQSVDPSQTMVPLKSTMMAHLRTKYRGELEYMLLEFRKLERQLLGAKGAAQIEESAGSRERREKLHSFILHLEDTIRQIEEGCRLEAESLTKEGSTGSEMSSLQLQTPDAVAKRKEAEESVQKLEEHILANLLPVKVRLKKQLAAQQGATRNPAGMPAPRRGSYVASSSIGAKGTFAAAAEQRRKQAEAARLAAQQQQEQKMREVADPTQFGTPLNGGSSLTRNLHGTTLGSKQRIHGHGVGASTKSNEEHTGSRILYGGMVPESTQHRSGVAAASGVHEMVIENPSLMTPTGSVDTADVLDTETDPVSPLQSSSPVQLSTETKVLSEMSPAPKVPLSPPQTVEHQKTVPVRTIKVLEARKETCDKALTEDESRKMKKNRRKRKLLRLAKRREKERQNQVVAPPPHPTHVPVKVVGGGLKKTALGKNNGRKKGPRAVEYICALCNDPYNSTCDSNPWWALAQQECPKCRKVQIPRIDIAAPANQIEYHPALLAHIDDNGGNVGTSASTVSQYLPKSPAPIPPHARVTRPIQHPNREPSPSGSDSDSDLSELSDGSFSDVSVGSQDSEFDISSLTPAEQAEHETFGHKYKGPVLSEDHASRLLVLMQHSSTCPCKHKSKRHRDVCRSVKYLMLHVRDCPGTTSNFDVCPFPWCRKVKHLLYHLVSCTTPEECKICSPTNLSPSLQALRGLNQFRAKKYRERLITCIKRSAAARRAALPLVYNGKKTGPQPPSYTAANGIPKANPSAYPKQPPGSLPPSAIGRKGKKSVTPPTVAAPPLPYSKPASTTSPTRHSWTPIENGKQPPKQTSSPIPQHIQSSKGTLPRVASKNHPGGAINGVVDKVPVSPPYASVEDPLRSSAQGAGIPPVTNANSSPKPGVPVPAASSQQSAHHATTAHFPAGPAADPVVTSVAEQGQSSTSPSCPKVLLPATTAVEIVGVTLPEVGQHETASRNVSPVSSPHAPATEPVSAVSRDVAPVAFALQHARVKEIPVQPTSTSNQAVDQATPQTDAVHASLPAAVVHKTEGAAPLSVAEHPVVQSAPMPSESVASALQPTREVAQKPISCDQVQSTVQPTATATNLVSVPDHPVAKLSASTNLRMNHSTNLRMNHEKVSLSTESAPAMIQQGAVSAASDTTPDETASDKPLHPQLSHGLSSETHSVVLAKLPSSGKMQPDPKSEAHCKTETKSRATIEKCVQDSGTKASPETMEVCGQTSASPPSNGTSSSALSPSLQSTSQSDTATKESQLASGQQSKRVPEPFEDLNAPLHPGAPARAVHMTKPPTCTSVLAPLESAERSWTASATRPQANATKVLESPTVAHDILANPAAPVNVAKLPVGPRTDMSSAPRLGAPTSPIDATNVSASDPVKEYSKPATEQHLASVPPTGIPVTGLADAMRQNSTYSSAHAVPATSSSQASKPPTEEPENSLPDISNVVSTVAQTPSVHVAKAIPKSSSASQVVQTKLEAGRSVSPSTAEHGTVEARKVEQSADIVQVGG